MKIHKSFLCRFAVALGVLSFSAPLFAEALFDNGILTVPVDKNETRSYTSDELTAIASGSCTEIHKTGEGILKISDNATIMDFAGTIRVKDGVYDANTDKGALGTEACVTYVESGATIVFSKYANSATGNHAGYNWHTFHIAGTGYGSYGGALVSTTESGYLAVYLCQDNIILDDDATIYSEGTQNFRFIVGTAFELGGHTLTFKKGAGSNAFPLSATDSITIKDSGGLVFDHCNVLSMPVLDGEGAACSLSLANGAKINLNNLVVGKPGMSGWTFLNLNEQTVTSGNGSLDFGLGIAAGQTLVLNCTDAANASPRLIVEKPIVGGGNLQVKPAANATVVLSGDNTYAGTTTLSSGLLELAADATLSGTSGVIFDGGRMLIDGGDAARAVSLPAVTQKSGAADLRVVGNTSVTIANASHTAGSLNIVADDSATVSIAGLAGQSPAWLTMRGVPVIIDSNGTVKYAVREIAAKGDQVPNDSGMVGITSAGSGDNTTLEADSVAVGSLAQLISSPATIAIGAGQQLTLGSLQIADTCGNLTFGGFAGVGTVCGADGILPIFNRGADATLTINSGIGKGNDVRLECGNATLAGGAVNTVRVHVASGTLTLTGEKTFRLADVVIGTNAVKEAKIVFDGAKDVVVGEQEVSIGANYATVYDKVIVRAVVTNSYIHCDEVPRTWTKATDCYTAALFIGDVSRAIMEVQADSVISNRICLGNTYNTAEGKRNGMGAVYQTGGLVYPLKGSNFEMSSCIGMLSCNGYYRIDDGTLHAPGCFDVGAYSTGTLDQRGGVVKYDGYLGVGCAGKGLAVFRGGTTPFGDSLRLASGSQGCDGIAVLENGADITTKTVSQLSERAGVNHIAVFALNGGALKATGFYQRKRAIENSNPQMTVGFNGGVFRPAGTYNDVFWAATDDIYTNVEHVVVYGGGCTIDTDGKNGNRATCPLEGPVKNGVKSVPFAGTVGGLPCAPVVIIRGDGYGAVAVAEFDVMTQTFTGIRVVQPGSGYTWAKAYVYYVSSSVLAGYDGVDCVLEENVNDGPFIKAGAGEFVLSGMNTYGGDTVLAGGELMASVEGAIPAGSTIVFAGGTLSLGAGVSAPTKYAVDYNRFAEIGTITYAGDLTFPEDATMVLRNLPADGLPDRAVLMSVTGTVRNAPEVTAAGLPESHKLKWSGGRLILHKQTGILMIVR